MLRSLTLLFLCLSLALSAMAQRFNRGPIWYFSSRANIGNFYGGQFSAAAIINVRHEISVGYEAVFRRSKSFPEDYECPGCHHGPGNDYVEGVTLSYGYVMYPLMRRLISRIVLRSGLMIGKQSSYGNFRTRVNPGPRGDNYVFDRYDRFSVALLVRPSLDIAPLKAFGISVGPFGFVSRDFIGGGLSIGTLLGHVNYYNARSKRVIGND